MIDSGAALVAVGICETDRGKPGHECRFCRLTIPEIESAVEAFWRKPDADHIAAIYDNEPSSLQHRRLQEAQGYRERRTVGPQEA
jgi:hypothetical protein